MEAHHTEEEHEITRKNAGNLFLGLAVVFHNLQISVLAFGNGGQQLVQRSKNEKRVKPKNRSDQLHGSPCIMMDAARGHFLIMVQG